MARRLYLVVPPGINSFYYSATYAYSYIDSSMWNIDIVSSPKLGGLNGVIDDMWNMIHKPRKAPIWWVDTPLYYLDRERPKIPRYVKEIWVTSSWNLYQCREMFSSCDIIPRLPNPIYLASEYSAIKEYDIAFVGSCWWRKFCKQFKDISESLNLKYWITGDYARLSLIDLVEKLKKTRFIWWITGSEGFGLPALEAQLLGVIPICINAHANKDFCFSMNLNDLFKVDPEKEYIKMDITGRHKIWEPDWNEVKMKLRELKNMDRDEYQFYSVIVRNSAVRLVEYTAKKLNKKLYSAYTRYF